jgi:hypothetical protein
VIEEEEEEEEEEYDTVFLLKKYIKHTLTSNF